MANQFNYELDDRHIKLTMLNATVPINEDAWLKIKSAPINDHKMSLSSGSIPKFEIGISRSVIVPVFFIVLIGGLSALLFSLVDFKKKEPVISEIPLVIPEIVPEKKVQKTVITPTQVTKKYTAVLAIATEKKEIPKETEKKIDIPKTQEVIVKKEEPQNIVEKPAKEKKTEVIAKTSSKKRKNSVSVSKKKKKKQIIEEIPVITHEPTILTEKPKEEPEIDIN